MALVLTLGAVVPAAGIFVTARRSLPSYNRLLGVYTGAVGIAGFASQGWNRMSAALVVIGSVSVFEFVYERITGRSADML